MKESAKNKGLGRGLAALMGDLVLVNDQKSEDREIPADMLHLLGIDQLRPNRFNPRKIFDDEGLAELSASIKAKGILQPLLVRKVVGYREGYEIIAGERRWRAAQKAGLHDVKAIIIKASDQEILELALIENIQRSNLNPMEEAEGYQRLLEDFDYTQSQLSKIVGKSRSHIANTVRLLGLPPAIRVMVESHQISAGHARALLTTPEPKELADRIVKENLSVREVERLAQERKTTVTKRLATTRISEASAASSDITAFQKSLNEVLGVSVKLNHQRDGSGEIIINYDSIDQCQSICDKLIG